MRKTSLNANSVLIVTVTRVVPIRSARGWTEAAATELVCRTPSIRSDRPSGLGEDCSGLLLAMSTANLVTKARLSPHLSPCLE